jgi:hypothetical protein
LIRTPNDLEAVARELIELVRTILKRPETRRGRVRLQNDYVTTRFGISLEQLGLINESLHEAGLLRVNQQMNQVVYKLATYL